MTETPRTRETRPAASASAPQGRPAQGKVRETRKPQVRPATEGWTQQKDAEGRPLLQFASPKRGKPPVHLADLTPAERVEKVKELGLPGFRAKQLSTHYFRHYTSDPEQMTDLPADTREQLVAGMLPPLLTEVRRLETDRGDTIKFLWRLHDGALVESVLMRYPGRITLCVSSQAGCGMNCPFCATGQAGLTRNMSTAEIIEQIVRANRLIAEGGLGGKKSDDHSMERVSNIVFMGMGEPLANFDAVWTAVERLNHDVGIGARRITVSTVGIVPGIKRLAAADLPVNLAVSLHAANDRLRNRLAPVNRQYPLADLARTLQDYRRAKSRRISLEWAMIDGVNDSRADAHELAEFARPLAAHVNLIPLNATPGYPMAPTPPEHIERFAEELRAIGVNATVRANRGTDIDAACGQLRAGASVRVAVAPRPRG
ncbi:23S rRNA (adenine(2503)-C(2))-methyltransferase RlmN [Microbacterium maritypicum]|uniref:23S rRNA (adenine(2503)-C(2))-methyltransferase RlmN n=1 Tax=Microbacterium maritypicum TaxID=33918 RepID=UPI00296F6423|nr:23S rRNA (adenine(2503)-C(2))-methyltransferase RlmN [Microbacterium liquefaciens]